MRAVSLWAVRHAALGYLFWITPVAAQPAPAPPAPAPPPAEQPNPATRTPAPGGASPATSATASGTGVTPPATGAASTTNSNADVTPFAQSSPAPSPTPGSTAPSTAGTSTTTAAATASPLSGQRAGTLGFPGNGATGVVAALKIQGGRSESTQFDVLTQIGQLQLAEGIAIDIVAERVSLDVPSTAFTPGTAQAPTTPRPLPKLSETGLTSAGFRFRLSPTPPTNSERRRLSVCLNPSATKDVRTRNDCPGLEKRFDLPDTTKATTDDDRLEAWNRLEEAANIGWSLALGARFLYRSEQITGNAPGIAGEFTPQLGFSHGALFASESVLWLRDSQQETDGVEAETSADTESRSTFGGYYRFNAPIGDVQTAPRIGGYITYSRNFWTNRFAVEGTESKVSGYDVEGGVFVSGHFSGGFNGLFQMALRRAYGSDSTPQFIFSVIPSLGTAAGGGT
jgi:hypothetical protein